MEIELRHLRLVRAVADHGSITKAAAVLGTTQPAATRQLRRLEDSLGGALFHRSRDGVEATALGKLVVNRARSVLPAVDSLRVDAELAMGESGPVQVHVGTRVGAAMMGMLRGVRATLPSANVVTDSETRVDALIDLVTSGGLDAAVVHTYDGHDVPLPSDVQKIAVATEPVFVMMGEDHLLAQSEELDLADLADQQWVINPLDADGEHTSFIHACEEAGFQPKVSHYLAGSPSIELIRRGEGLGLCFAVARISGICSRPLVGSPLRIQYLLLVNRKGPLQPVATRVASFVDEEVTRVAEQHDVYGPWLARHGKLPTAR